MSLVSLFTASAAVFAPSIAAAAPVDPPPVMAPRRLGDEAVPYPAGGAGDATVTLVLVVDADGHVANVDVRDGAPPFADAAARAVEAWQFAPATRDGTPIKARIVASITFHAPTASPPGPPKPPESPAPTAPTLPTPTTLPSPAAPATPPEVPIEIGVHGERREPSTNHIARSEAQYVAGAFGDPVRAVEALPGMSPFASGLPYYFVRGSQPETVGYFVDGISIPLLFHVGAGPSTLAPALVDSVDLFPGAYPARYGRFSGAVIAVDTTSPDSATEVDRPRADVGARVYDAHAYGATPFDDGKGSVVASARYSYTGLLTSLVVPNYSLGYWDYQGRISHTLGAEDRLTVFALGAHDELHYLGQPTFRIEYHRVDLRYDRALEGGHLRVAGTFSDDDTLTALQTSTGAGADAALKSLGGRVRAELDDRVAPRARLRAGADFGTTHFSTDDFPANGAFPAVHGPHTDFEAGLYADVVWRPTEAIELVPGARVDGYRSRSQTGAAPQPRLATQIALSRAVSWVSALGTAHQEPTEEVFVPSRLPDPIDESSRTSYQASEGVEARFREGMRARLSGFYSRVVATHVLGTDQSEQGHSAGLELFVHRDFSNRLGGFLSYTLSRTVGTVRDVTQRVSWDRTHVLSAVLGYDLRRGWRVGARLFFESGRPSQTLCETAAGCPPGSLVAVPGNLPSFYRVDWRVEKTWTFRSGQWLTGSLECFNTLDRAEPIGNAYSPATGVTVRTQSAIILPSVGVEAGF